MSHTNRWLLLLLIISVAVMLRFWRIDSIPPGFDLDESYEGLEAWHILNDPTYRPVYLTVNYGVPPLNSYVNAVTFGLFQFFGAEIGPTAMRVTAATLGVLGVLALYALACEMQIMDGAVAGLSVSFPFFAAAVLAVMRWHVHFSRVGIEPILVPLLWASAFWLLLRGWRTSQWANFAGSGVMAAAAIYAYQGAWLMPVLMVLAALHLLLCKAETKGWLPSPYNLHAVLASLRSRQGVGLVIMLAAALAVMAPFGWYMWHHLDIVMTRPGQVAADISKDIAARNAIWRSLWRVATMYGPFGDSSDLNTRRNIPGTPALNVWLAIPFYVGLVLAGWRWRRPSYAIVLGGLVGLLLPGAVSLHQPHLHRLLGATAPTALLCGIALDRVWQWRPKLMTSGRQIDDYAPLLRLRRLLSSIGRQAHWVSLLLLVLGGATATYEYFARWSTIGELYYKFDGPLWDMGRQIAAQSPDTPIYMTPFDISHPTLAFAWETRHHPAPVSFDGHVILPFTAHSSTRPELYAVLDYADSDTGQHLAQLFPTLRVQQELRDLEGNIYGRLYQRPANTTPQLAPQYSRAADLQDGIALLGYDLQSAAWHPGDTLNLQLHWLVKDAPTRDWKVFTRLILTDTVGKVSVSAKYNSRPGKNSLPTDRWQAGWRILDQYPIKLPDDLVPGTYGLEIGLYLANQDRYPKNKRGLFLRSIKVEPSK